jgi:hypothetical protein
MKSLEASLQLLFNVFGFVFFFMLVFALIGVMTYRGSFMRACYQMEADGSCKWFFVTQMLLDVIVSDISQISYPSRAN